MQGLEVVGSGGLGVEEIGRMGHKGTSDQEPNCWISTSPPGFYEEGSETAILPEQKWEHQPPDPNLQIEQRDILYQPKVIA